MEWNVLTALGLTYINMYHQLTHQAREIDIGNDSWTCVRKEILQLILKPQRHHVGCIVQRLNEHFSEIELTLNKETIDILNQ